MTREALVSDLRLPMYRVWSRRCAFGLYVVAALWGTLQLVCANTSGVYLLFALTFALLATSWAVFDSKPLKQFKEGIAAPCFEVEAAVMTPAPLAGTFMVDVESLVDW